MELLRTHKLKIYTNEITMKYECNRVYLIFRLYQIRLGMHALQTGRKIIRIIIIIGFIMIEFL